MQSPTAASVVESAVGRRSIRSSKLVAFTLIWLGQTSSLFGAGLSGFALGVWIYEGAGSVTRLGLIFFCSTVPQVLAAPFIGSLLDRWDRRLAMILGNLGDALSILLLGLLIWSQTARFWQVCLLIVASSAMSSVQRPAFAASTTLLVPGRYLDRANGMLQFGQSLANLLAPLIAGLLLGVVAIHAVVFINVGAALFAVLTLLLARIPQPTSVDGEPGGSSLWRDCVLGLRFIRERRGLLLLLLLLAGTNFALGAVQVLITPLILAFSTAQVLGTVVSFAALGMVAGGGFTTLRGGFSHRMKTILGLLALQGVMLTIAGLRPNAVLIAGCAFAFLFCLPIIASASMTLWQRKVPTGVQGRVFAMRQMVMTTFLPVAYLLAGPLVDYVFAPLVRTDGPLAASVGSVIGSGEGRGIALLFIVLGLSMVLAAFISSRCAPLRNLERELPDAGMEEG